MATAQIQAPVAVDTSAVIERARQLEAAPTQGARHDQLVAQTEKWVATTFYGELLKQMRESPFRSDEFEGGKDSKSFETLLDQRLADHMSRHAGGKLVHAIVNKIEAASRYAGNSKLPAAHGKFSQQSRTPRTVSHRHPLPVAHTPRKLHETHAGPHSREIRHSLTPHTTPLDPGPARTFSPIHMLHPGGRGMPERHAGMMIHPSAHHHTKTGKHF